MARIQTDCRNMVFQETVFGNNVGTATKAFVRAEDQTPSNEKAIRHFYLLFAAWNVRHTNAEPSRTVVDAKNKLIRQFQLPGRKEQERIIQESLGDKSYEKVPADQATPQELEAAFKAIRKGQPLIHDHLELENDDNKCLYNRQNEIKKK